jgi:acetyltransferase-like isoleucine patch superfamily enzyme
MISKLFYSSELLKCVKGLLSRMINKKKVSIGRRFKCDGIPYIHVTDNGKITIGNDVSFRRDVEIRVHKNARLSIGDNCQIDRGVRILATNSATVILKKGTKVGLYSVFNGGDRISIGENCLISGFVYLQTSMHNYDGNNNIQTAGYSHAPVTIGDDVWIGAHVTVLPGCCLRDGSVVGSNAVVTKSTRSGDIIAGVPAKKINNRNDSL